MEVNWGAPTDGGEFVQGGCISRRKDYKRMRRKNIEEAFGMNMCRLLSTTWFRDTVEKFPVYKLQFLPHLQHKSLVVIFSVIIERGEFLKEKMKEQLKKKAFLSNGSKFCNLKRTCIPKNLGEESLPIGNSYKASEYLLFDKIRKGFRVDPDWAQEEIFLVQKLPPRMLTWN